MKEGETIFLYFTLEHCQTSSPPPSENLGDHSLPPATPFKLLGLGAFALAIATPDRSWVPGVIASPCDNLQILLSLNLQLEL